MQSIVQKFRGTLKDASLEDDVRQAFKTKEALMKLDTKLEDFAETKLEVNKYQQIVKKNYDSLDLLEASEFVEIIKKFKRKHPDILLV